MKNKFINQESGQTITFETDIETCSDVVRSFYYFLLASSYNKASIIEALQEVLQEYDN